ncbi:hypothetical protein CLV84_2128 [Neolewinella xylanilytica]|uniref:Uncharacterized protein n=1 Tax=Neolewinella xylanilytica TaxID=1514080 RepID=A0A2S6I231_9BACT|nr:hypothetical protein [Neolewinella xylanilytica]PPK85236.1 hypothetical protein CLV84_2128 [Neolewinella xylanilytica]
MNDLDELFRGGLGDRKPEVPQELWDKIAARRTALPEGEEIDRLFANRLANRQPPVPAGMWQRVRAARRRAPLLPYAVLALLLLGTAAGVFWALPQEQDSFGPTDPLATRTPFTISPSATTAPSTGPASVPPAEPELMTGMLPEQQGTENLLSARYAAPPTPASEGTAPVATPARIPITVSATVPTLRTDRVEPLSDTAVFATLPLPGPGHAFRATGGHRLRLEFLLGAAYAHQRFVHTAEGARELRSAREVSEFPQLSYQLSARLRYQLRPRWHLLTGLTYVDIRNQLEYERMNNGAKELMRSNNHLRMLEVPLLASYAVSGRRLRLNVNAGPVINLFTAVDGAYLHPDFAEPQSFGDEYRRNIGIGWTASLTTTYLVGKDRGTQLLLEPFFKSYPGSFTPREAPLSERYWLGGLQIGLRKSL